MARPSSSRIVKLGLLSLVCRRRYQYLSAATEYLPLCRRHSPVRILHLYWGWLEIRLEESVLQIGLEPQSNSMIRQSLAKSQGRESAHQHRSQHRFSSSSGCSSVLYYGGGVEVGVLFLVGYHTLSVPRTKLGARLPVAERIECY